LIYSWLRTKPCLLLLEIWSGLMFTLLCLSLNVLYCSSFSLVFDFFFWLENIMFFVFWFCFGLNLHSRLVLGWTLVFGLVYGWTNVFRSIQLDQNRAKYLRLCFVRNCFVKRNFGLRVCLTSTSFSLFWFWTKIWFCQSWL
jgi:hypothetical protein